MRRLSFAALAITLLPLTTWAETKLYMAEEQGCMWCERWMEELGPIYPKTAEGAAAPLVRYDLQHDTPDVEFARAVHFTPTFILVQDGVEIGRIEGYPGEDFFWGLLGMVMDDAGIILDSADS